MSRSLTYYLIFNVVYTTAFIIYICGNREPMIPWWIILLAAAIPPVISACVTMYVRFTSEQHEIAKTIAEFQLFMESWKRLTSDYNDMKERLDHLEEENQELRQKLENRHNADIPHSRI